MKNILQVNQSFGTVGSPNQTGETLTRENRVGLMSYLRRTLMLLFAVLVMSIGNVWGTPTQTYTLTGSSTQITNGHCAEIGGAYCGRRGSNFTPNSTYGLPSGGGNTAAVFVVNQTSTITFVLDNQQTSAKTGTVKLASVTNDYYTACQEGTLGAFPSESQTKDVSFAKSADLGENEYTFESSVSAGKYVVYWTSGINASIYLKRIEINATGGGSSYSITYHCNDATSGCPATNPATGQTALPNPLPSVTKTNYAFGGWYTDAAYSSAASAGATLSANADLYAKWTQTITLDREGATTGSTSVTATYNSATLGSITNPSKDGYTFAGWYDGDDGTGNLVINTSGELQDDVSGYTDEDGKWTSSSARTLHAKWTETQEVIAIWPMYSGSSLSLAGSTSVSSIITPSNAVKAGSNFADITEVVDASFTDYTGKMAKLLATGTIGSSGSVTADHYVKYTITVASGYSFTPTGFSAKVARYATDNAYAQVVLKQGSTTIKSSSGSQPNRSGKSKAVSVYSAEFDDADTYDAGTAIDLYIYFGGGLASDKNFGIADVSITGEYAADAPSGYSITYDCDEADSGCPSDASGQTALPSPLPSAPTKTGYTFGGWYTDNTLETEAIAGATLSDDVTLYAKWTPIDYTITHNAATNGSYTVQVADGSPVAVGSSVTANYGQTITLAATPSSGYVFDYWSATKTSGGAAVAVSNSKVSPATFTMPAEAVTVMPHFKQAPNIYYYKDATHYDGSVYKNPEGNAAGTALSSTWSIYSSGITGLTSVVAKGCCCVSSSNYMDAYICLPVSGDKDTKNITITIASNYQATVKMKIGATGAQTPVLTLKPLEDDVLGDEVSYTGTAGGNGGVENDYNEITWTDLPEGVYVLTCTTYTLYISEIDIRPESLTTYNVTYKANGSGEDDVEHSVAKVESNMFTLACYTFTGWNTANDGTGDPYEPGDLVTEDLTLFAQWSQSTYTVSFAVAAGSTGYGTVSTASISSVACGSTVSIASNVLTLKATDVTATPTSNTAQYSYAFTGWSVSNGASITSEQTITASFSRTTIPYTLAWDKNGSGDDLSGSYSSGSIANGSSITAPNNPTWSGYRFTGWNSAQDGSGDAPTGTMPTANTTYYAQWVQLYTITNGSPSNGTITVASSAAASDVVDISVEANTGYSFSEWNIYKTGTPATTISPAAATASTSFTMPAYAVTVDATFALNTYDVTTTLNHTTKASGTTGTGAATHGTEYSATFTAADGYVLPSDVTVTIGGVAQTKGTGYTWSVSAGVGTFTVPAAKVTGAIVLTITSTVDCPASGSGRTVYKFVTKSSGLGTGQVCAAANTDYPQTTSNALSEISGGALIARGTGSLTQLSYNNDCYNFNGTNCWLKMELDCELKSGDIIRYINKNSGSVYIRHTSNTTTTDQITLAGNSKTTIQTIVVPANFATKSTIYLIRASNTSYISYFEIIRPYVVTLNANTNGGKVDGEDTKTMYFVADEAQLLPRATKSDYLFKGWFNASSGGDAVANPYTATTSPKTLYAQFDDCSSKIGTVYKLQVKTELTNGSIAAGDLNEGNYLSAMDGGTAVITGSHAQIVNNNAIDFKDNGDYITVNLDCELKAGDYFKTTISGSKSGIKVTTTGSTTSLQDISYGTNVETEVPASLVGSKTFRIYRQDSNCGGLSYFEIVRPAGSEVTYNNGGHGEAPSSTTAAAVTLADISVTGWKNTGWKADVDVKVSGSTVSAGTEIAVGTVVTILEATTFTAQWVDCCFEFAGGTKDSGWPVDIDGSITTSLYKTSTGAVLTGGTVVNSGTVTIGSNDGVKGLVFDAAGNNAITITLSGTHAFAVGTVITISGASGDDNSSSNNFGFSVNGNNLETTSLSSAKASFEKSYTVAASDGVDGGKTIQIKLNTSCLRKTYLKSVTVTGCADCTPIDPELSYSKTTIWMDDATLTATPTLSGYYGTPTISYASSDPTVVRVDNSSTGAITALKRGTATVTATIGETTVETTDYCGNTASCEITVKDVSCGEVVIAGVTATSKNAGTPEGTLIAASDGYKVNLQDWVSPDGGCGTGGKIGGDNQYIYLTLKSGEYFKDGDKVIVNIAKVPGVGDSKLHIYDGTTTLSDASTMIGTSGTPSCGENEIVLSGVPANTSSITLHRGNGPTSATLQNPYVTSMKVKRYMCPDSKEFLPTGDNGNWDETDNWIGATGRGASLPTSSDRVVISKPVTVNVTNAVAGEVVIDQHSSNTGKLTIQPNKGLEVTGLVQKTTDGSSYTCTSEADLILESSSAGNASLVFDNSNNNHATVALYSKASVEGSTWNWQYIGTALSDANALYDYYGSYLYKWSGGWTAVANGANMEAFAGYCIANKTANTTYITEGTLVPTTSHSVDIAAGKDMVLANSWTAPISIASFTNTTFTSTPATVYLFNTGSAVNGSSEGSEAGTYIAVPIASAPYTGNGLIAPQQGFFVTAKNGTAGTITMNYSELVRPAGSHTDIVAGPMKSPVRRDMPLADYDPNVMKIKVSGSVYTDRVIILERADFTEGFDNGWDGERKGMGKVSPSIYVINADGKKDAVSAIPDYEGTLVGFKAGSGDTEYVMTFNYDGDDILYLNDLKEETSTQISEGNTYTFTTESGDSDARFVISATPFIKTTPTGLDDAEWNGNGVRKVIHNDHMYIIRGGRVFDAVGGLVK